MRILKTILLLLSISWVVPSYGQYFGKNKPRYTSFDFHNCQTEHFDIYHYLENEEYLKTIAEHTERWFAMHNEVFQDSFQFKNPMIFYNNHADFQQTRAISGGISTGTGGVTEAFKNRVILPFAMSNQQTHHVLGHELVHAFQYHSVIYGDSTSLRNMANYPLWIVEGLAEYMSLGSKDAHTSMWMRDAVLNDRIPSLTDLNNPAFFPYRYGQAFWSFLTGNYGDGVIRPFFSNIAKFGMEDAIRLTLGLEPDDLSDMWVKALKDHYQPFLDGKTDKLIGKKLLSEENSGRMNISPVLSPDGKYVAFLSEKDLFSIDVFLADARSGKIIRKIASTSRDAHFDAFNFIESAGTWSPDSKEFAIVGFRKGENAIQVKDVQTGKTTTEFTIPGVPAFGNITWSPNGRSIALAGLVDGQVDLYDYNFKSGKVKQLTDDKASEMQPIWSSDGSTILYATDKLSEERGLVDGRWTFNIAELDVESKATKQYDVFYGADNLNPIYDYQDNILFLSNRDGYRNLYKYDKSSDQVKQMTDFLVGISGITHYSPAITASRKRDRILYSYFTQGKYSIYQTQDQKFMNKDVASDAVDMTPATLPPAIRTDQDVVNVNLKNIESVEYPKLLTASIPDFEQKFKLDYIGGGGGVGVGSSQNFGTTTGLAGGVSMLFSNILGDNKLFGSLQVNGEIYDFGGQVSYLNEKKQVAWGASLSHVPYRFFGGSRFVRDTVTLGPDNPRDRRDIKLPRLFEQQLGLFAQLPFTSKLRVEVGGSITRYSVREELFQQFYIPGTNFLEGTRREKIDSSVDPFGIAKGYVALVGDNTTFGLASPIMGHRFRIEANINGGKIDYGGLTLDARKYIFARPFTIAGKLFHLGRYGKDFKEDNFNNFSLENPKDLLARSIYIGNQFLLRGFQYANRPLSSTADDLYDEQLFGSKVVTANFEVRIPFTGPKQLALVKSKFLFSEIALFFDGGAAFDDFSDFNNTYQVVVANEDPSQPNSIIDVKRSRFIASTGLSLRLNVFGAMILEPYYAIPLTGNFQPGFGINILPGW